jgi:HEAT repeat protein
MSRSRICQFRHLLNSRMDILDSLLAQLTAGDDARAETAAAELAQHGPTAVEALRQVANDPQADHRWWAIRVLSEIPDPQVPGLLSAALHDPDPSVRQCALLGLRQQPDSQAVAELITLLEAPNSLTADLAGDALVAVSESAVEPLLVVLADGHRPARLRAAKALALIGDPRAIPALFHALDEDSALLEYWANEGLDRMGIGMIFFKP